MSADAATAEETEDASLLGRREGEWRSQEGVIMQRIKVNGLSV